MHHDYEHVAVENIDSVCLADVQHDIVVTWFENARFGDSKLFLRDGSVVDKDCILDVWGVFAEEDNTVVEGIEKELIDYERSTKLDDGIEGYDRFIEWLRV